MMKRFLLALSLLSASVANAGEQGLPGFDRFAVSAAHRPSLMQGSVWYPAGTRTYAGFVGKNPVFKGTRAMVGAGVKEGRYPVLLFSYGSGGNMDNLSWLSSALAKQGIIVVGVNHPGSTSGDSSPRRSLQPAKRAADLSAALDHLLSDPYFSQFIDEGRIVAGGFSLGGATALTLAGVSFDAEAYADYCGRFEGTAQDCLFFAKGDVDLASMAYGLEESGLDPRIRGVIAIDPGFTYAVDSDSLSKISIPIELISLGRENLWRAADVGENGSDLIGKLKNATHVTLYPAHHFTFLAECTDEGARLLEDEQDDPVCDDPEGTDRSAIHEKIADTIGAFVLKLK